MKLIKGVSIILYNMPCIVRYIFVFYDMFSMLGQMGYSYTYILFSTCIVSYSTVHIAYCTILITMSIALVPKYPVVA